MIVSRVFQSRACTFGKEAYSWSRNLSSFHNRNSNFFKVSSYAQQQSPASLTSESLLSNQFVLSHVRCTGLLRSTHRLLSSSSEVTDTLVDILTREHAEELENENQIMSDDLKELHEKLSKEWKIVDNPDNAIVRMYKTLPTNNAKVQVSFHCQDVVEEDQPIQDDDPEANEDMDVSGSGVKFTVTITKAGNTAVFTCLSVDASVKIQSCSVSTTEDADTLIDEGGSVSLDQYQGPEFNLLADDLQDSFHQYLEESVGLSPDFAAYVSMYTDYKEQKKYVEFLDTIKSIIKN